MSAARKETDRRIRKVLAALEIAQAYDDARRARGEGVLEGEVDHLVFRELFDHETLDDWPAERMRAFVVAACTLAPASMLNAWVKRAADFLVQHEEYAREQAKEDEAARQLREPRNDNQRAA